MLIQIRNDYGETHEVHLIRRSFIGWLEVADSDGSFDVADSYVIDPTMIGDPNTLCGSPRCSLGENHTAPCDEFAEQFGI